MVRKAPTEPLICAELCCLKDMATRCPFGWNARFQSNLSILEAKNVSAPCATQENFGANSAPRHFWCTRPWFFGVFLFAILSIQLYFINLIYKYQAIHFFSLRIVVFVLCAQDLSSPVNAAIDGSVLPHFSPGCSLSPSALFFAKFDPSFWA